MVFLWDWEGITLKLTETTTDRLKAAANGSLPPWTTTHPWTFPTAVSQPPEPPISQVTPLAAPVRKIAIIGTAPSSRDLAPYNDPSWEIWGCSAGNKGVLPRVDCWFEIHGTLLDPGQDYGKPYLEWLNSQTFPIYMQNSEMVTRAQAFPFMQVLDEFGPDSEDFFSSSFSWMLGFAIKSGATEIGLWGVDMASKDEYIQQRPGGRLLIREAKKRGVKVFIPDESDLAQPPALYGLDDMTPFGRKMGARQRELESRIAQLEREMGQIEGQRGNVKDQITYLRGALEDITYARSVWGGVQSTLGGGSRRQ